MSRWAALAVGALVGAVGCAIVAIVQFSAESNCEIERVYFQRSGGAPAYGEILNSRCDDFSLTDPHLWLGAAIAFAIMSLAILAASRLRRSAA
jgi:hypothetical protein